VADISIGADVMAADDKLGEVTRAIVDAHSGKVTDIVVKHGVLLTHERIVPLGHVTRAADGKVYLDLDEKGLEAMNGFAREIKGPNPDYVGPPSEDLQGTYRGNEAFEEMAAAGSAGGYGLTGKPMGYPGGEQLTPDFAQRPAVSKGTAVIGSDGEQIGDLGEFSFTADDGRPTRIALQRGLLFKHDVDLPLEWLREIGDDGILLNVPKDQVEEWASRAEERSR
jgi:uncharacterized protein YrrD